MDDLNPRIPRSDTILYEMHVRGFTCHPSSGVRHPGTFAGLAEKVALPQGPGRDGGRTPADRRVRRERLPVHQPIHRREAPEPLGLQHHRLRGGEGRLFQQLGGRRRLARSSAGWSRPSTRAGWRSSSTSSSTTPPKGARTARPTISGVSITACITCWTRTDKYLNFAGCGNAVNSNHPVVRSQILSCLRNAVAESGVDGFRFDLASVLGRDKRGNVLLEPPVIEQITEDALLADTKMIAEPWDAAGLYQVGNFPGGHRWSVWNGQYRDDVRRFWQGEAGMTSRPGDPALRIGRRLSRARAAALDQLHHLSRRFHARRPRLLQPEAQRDQRRREPRRVGREL